MSAEVEPEIPDSLNSYPLNPAGTVFVGKEGAKSIVIKLDLIGYF